LSYVEPLVQSAACGCLQVEESTCGYSGYPYVSVRVSDKSKDREEFVRKLRDDA
jgi:hypothetical protein